MRNLLLLLIMLVSMTAQAQKTVYMFIDLTDESLIETHLSKAKDAIDVLVSECPGKSLRIKFLKITHNPFPAKLKDVTIPAPDMSKPTMARRGPILRAIQAAKSVLVPNNFKYENSPNTAIYASLKRQFINKKAFDKAIIFSDLEENTDTKAAQLDVMDKEIFGVISVRENVHAGSINYWTKVLPGMIMDSAYDGMPCK